MNSVKTNKENKNLSLSFHIKGAITMYDYFKLSRVTKKRIYPTFISTIDGMLLTKIKIFFYNPEFIAQVTVY